MNLNSNVMLVTQTRVKPDKNLEFAQWQEMQNELLAQFPGYISQTITPPHLPIQQDWVVIQYFISANAAKAWLQSPERSELLKKSHTLIEGGEDMYLADAKMAKREAVTAAISSKITPEAEKKFLEWNSRIAAVQSKFPGFMSYKLERPRENINEAWIALITFDSDEHLEAWLNSPERKKLIDELNTFSSETRIRKAHSGFDFWFDSHTSKRSAWKENMLVLLTLYPVVFLLGYIQRPLMAQGMPFWLSLFFGNAASTAILGWITVPILRKNFLWWLNPPARLEKKYTFLGIAMVVLLYCLCLLSAWLLSKQF